MTIKVKKTTKDTKLDAYIQPTNNKIIEDYVKSMFDKGEFNPNNIMTNDFLDIPFYTLTFENIPADTNEVKKGANYWDNKLKEFIKRLEDRVNTDISNYSESDLKNAVAENNKDFFIEYLGGIKNNSLDLADEGVRLRYATRIAESITDLQLQEIKDKASMLKFLEMQLTDKNNAHIDKADDKITFYVSPIDLKLVQKKILEVFDKIDYHNASEINKEQIADSVFKQTLSQLLYLDQIKRADKQYEDNKAEYDKRHKLHLKVNNLTSKLAKIYKEQLDFINNSKLKVNAGEDILNEMQQQNKNIDNLSLTTTLVNTKIFDDFTFKSGEMVNVPINYIDKNAKTQQTDKIYITLTEKDNKDITLTPKHKVINDRIGTLIDYGYNKITARKLYNFINKGEISNDYVEPAKLEELKNDLNKMAVMGELDASEQFNNAIYKSRLDEYNKKTDNKGSAILHQHLLNFKYLEYKLAKGEDVMYYYVFLDYPLFYQYAKQIKQIAVVPAEIYNINDIPSKIKKLNKAFKYKTQITDITGTIRDNLINDIELRKSKYNNNINISNFFDECKFKDLDKRARETRLKAIETILNNWILKDYIKGYSLISNGKIKKYAISIYITAEELANAKKDKKIEVIDIKTFIL